MATRIPESMIREAILHPVEEIRNTALDYFSHFHTRDDTIMPLVIEATKKYGRAKSFSLLRKADSLPQTNDTMRWLHDELFGDLDWDNVEDDNYGFAIALILCQADLEQLSEPADAIANHPEFPDELRSWLLDRLEMRNWDWQIGWRELERFGRKISEQDELRLSDQRHGERIIEALARHSHEGSQVLPLLNRRYRGFDRELMESLEYFLVELSGRMRLVAAVPILVEHLQEDDLWLSNSCVTALKGIGGDEVVHALADAWPTGDGCYRRSAAEIMETIHTDLSIEKLMNFFAAEEDEETRDFLANALLGNFVPEAVPLVRQMVLGDELTPDENDLRLRLVAACAIMNVTFPEYDAWFEEGESGEWGWRKGFLADRIRKYFREENEGEDFWGDEYDYEDEEFEDDFTDWEGSGDEGYEDYYEGPPTLQPFRKEQPPVGRNDPCPCGSGKKYKKCCLGKQS